MTARLPVVEAPPSRRTPIGETSGGTRLRHDVRAITVLLRRDLLRLADQRVRMVVSLAQPMLFLLALGWGLTPVANFGDRVSVPMFMYPGALAMSVTFAAFFSADSIIFERDHGMLREMLVAPVGRWALAVGKTLGGTLIGGAHGVLMLTVAGLFGVPYDPLLYLKVAGQILVLAFLSAAIGVALASRTEKQSTFSALGPAVVMPLFALSGAMFPVSHLPAWLAIANRLDPLGYCVDPLRRILLSTQSPPTDQLARLGLDAALPPWLELLAVLVFASAFLGLSITKFRSAE